MKKLPIEYVDKRRKYILFKNDCGVTDMARWGQVYEHYIFDYIKNNVDIKGKNIIDIGANLGFHALEFAELVDSGKVYSFEPQRLVYYQLCGNILLNGFDNIYAYNIALSDETTTLLIENPDYHSEKTINIGDAHLNAFVNNGNNKVDVKPLDSFGFENVAVIKIDVQGYEPKVLDGAVQTIKRNKPIIFIEIEKAQLEIYGKSEKDIFDRLTALGYTYKKVHDAPHLMDYVAVPIESKLERKKVSFMCTTYRRFRCVERIVAQYHAQTYPNKELIIFNTDTEHPIELGFDDPTIKIINNGIDYQTGKPYENRGQICRDAVTHATGDYFMLADDDDIYLPWHMQQAVEGIEELGTDAWKPESSFFALTEKLELSQNVMEASIIVKMNRIREIGFRMDITGYEGLSWCMQLNREGQLDEHNKNYVPSYCFNWGDPYDMGGHKQSSFIGAPNNFENHKLASKDYATRPLVRLSTDEINNVYRKYYQWMESNKDKLNIKYYERYAKHFTTNSIYNKN